MEKTLRKKFRGVKVLMLLALAFAIGFECGRLSLPAGNQRTGSNGKERGMVEYAVGR